MLTKLDDFPVHQTSEPLAVPHTSDRNFYNRTWFNGYSADASYYFGIGIAIYPHREIMDCAFSVVRPGDRQYCFFGSRRIPRDITETEIGPFKMEVSAPMRRARISLDQNESGLSCDLTFEARTQPIQEARQTLWSGSRRTMDATRFAQFGEWQGGIEIPSGKIQVVAGDCLGTKDRSWGVRNVGEPELGGATNRPGGICFIWAPLFWSDHVSHAVFFDGQNGEPLVREGLEAPLHLAGDLDTQIIDESAKKLSASHRIKYEPNTRWAASAEIDLVGLDKTLRTITLQPKLRFMMKGLGYGHPQWKQGVWKGELETGSDSFEPDQLDPSRPENLHIQQIVSAEDGNRSGTGVLEQIVFGPYAPAGFAALTDGFVER